MRSPRFSATKFAPPAAPLTAIARPDIIGRLDHGVASRLALVVGAAGAGKTNLLLQWVRTRPAADTCWINVDEGDGDPVRFWHAIVAAVRSVRDGFGGAALALMADDGSFGPDVLESLIDELDGLDAPVTLVIDDLHLIDADDVSLAGLIARRPRGLHLVIGSRSEPRIGLGRLRATGSVGEVRDEDLRLGRDEAAAVLEGLGVAVGDRDLDRLMAQTEGWATGVHLAGVALQRSGDPSGFIDRLVSSSEEIAHYLSTQVVDAQPPEVQQFMLATCVVDELTPDLAAELSGGSTVSLGTIEAAELMLFRNSARPDVHRYHHLLLQLLRLRLRGRDRERERRLHRVAADWFEAERDLASCFRHRWRAGDRRAAMHLLARNVYDAYFTNRLPPISPNDFVLTDEDVVGAPGPAIAVATTLCLRHHASHADHLVRRIERLAGDGLLDTDRAELSCLHTVLAADRCDMEATVRHGEDAHRRARRASLTGDSVDTAATMLVRAYGWAGNWAAAEAAAERIVVGPGLSFVAIERHGALANLGIFRGHLGAGIDHARRARAMIDESGMAGFAVVSPTFALEGHGLLERGDLEGAASLLARFEAPGIQPRVPATIIADLARSRILFARGRAEEALATLAAARERVAHLDDSSWVAATINARTAVQLGAVGDLDRACVIAERLPDGVDRDLVRAGLRRALGDLAGAEEALARAASRSDCLRTDLRVALGAWPWRSRPALRWTPTSSPCWRSPGARGSCSPSPMLAATCWPWSRTGPAGSRAPPSSTPSYGPCRTSPSSPARSRRSTSSPSGSRPCCATS